MSAESEPLKRALINQSAILSAMAMIIAAYDRDTSDVLQKMSNENQKFVAELHELTAAKNSRI